MTKLEERSQKYFNVFIEGRLKWYLIENLMLGEILTVRSAHLNFSSVQFIYIRQN